MSIRTVSMATLAALLAFNASAQDGMPAPADASTDSRFQIDTAVLDTNRDGLLTREEAASNLTLNSNFAAIDSNGDGTIATEELRAWLHEGSLARRTGSTREMLGDDPARWFRTLDRDGDGNLSRDEARADARLAAGFAHSDVNRNGRLDAAEFRAWVDSDATRRMSTR
ncbi:EF-hand domain-containing protein [Cognatilysobacter xinjiangensis]|nr:EF-hand domain-containing protein [Lysobacter xinjiangensis]